MKHFVGYTGSSKAHFLSTNLTSPSWFICHNDQVAIELFEDLCFFYKYYGVEKKILHYPLRTSDLKLSQIKEDLKTHQRLDCLYNIHKDPLSTHLVTSIQALSQITISPKAFLDKCFTLMIEDEFEHENLLNMLLEAGYEKTTQCAEKGQFAKRGDILDIFAVNLDAPLRCEFFGDELQTMRKFDPETQRTFSHKDHTRIEILEIAPCREIFYPEDVARIITKLKNRAQTLGVEASERREIQSALSEKKDFAAISKFFPFFLDTPSTLWDHFTSPFEITQLDPFTCQQNWLSLDSHLQSLSEEVAEKKVLSADPLLFFPSNKKITQEINQKTTLQVSDVHIQQEGQQSCIETNAITTHETLQSNLAKSKKSNQALQPLIDQIQIWLQKDFTVRLAFHSEHSAKNIQRLLSTYFPDIPISTDQLDKKLSIYIGDLSQGFVDSEKQIVWISEIEIFGYKKHHVSRKSSKQTSPLEINALSFGDPIVHIDHGIGIYKGMKKMAIGKTQQDFVMIEYAKSDKLFLPIHRLSRIHAFISADGRKAKVDTLGTTQWAQAKQKTQKDVEEMAGELIALYAKRKVAKGFQYGPPDQMYAQFESEFPFDETRDQLATLEDIEEDLMGEKPMDRLVCGDVGFGKTEIALRTAFRVASEGKQVAVLVPTTILCQQHFETFQKRFASFPIHVDYVSRFKTRDEVRKSLEDLETGKTDIIVGTHRLLSKDIHFANIGLLILDEEHRFGVKHKESIKEFRNKIDVLTLTATPIPRTLQLSMTGIRDLSLINTPPLDRKAVHTILSSFDEATIQDAVYRETKRGGQVFFLHNRVESISSMHMFLQKLMPDIRIRVGHGQMDQKTLEQTMLDFLNHKFDLLLCTTIIESGIDVPNANTLLVNRADSLGLAQLYQLRGRVGRSNREAFAYLLIPSEEMITPTALKRLKTIKKYTELGSGLKIAMQDLEIRGAGNLLGAKQSGHISSVGFELYIQLLEREIRKLKGEKVRVEVEPELQVNMPALIPETYIFDHQERLLFYRKLSTCPNMEKLENLKDEMIDRFGKLPHLTLNLFELIELKILCRWCGVKTLSITSQNPLIEFSDQANIDMNALIKMIKKNPQIQLTPDQKLKIEFAPEIEPFGETKKILMSLSVHGKNT